MTGCNQYALVLRKHVKTGAEARSHLPNAICTTGLAPNLDPRRANGTPCEDTRERNGPGGEY